MITFAKPTYQLENFGPYVSFDNFFTGEECDNIIKEMTELQQAKVSYDGVKNAKVRSAQVGSLEAADHNRWIFEKIGNAIQQCNSECYKYDIIGFFEAVQLLKYEVGDFYDWHMDFDNKQYSIRKLSAVIQLSDPSEYEGGELEFFRNGKAPKDRGTMIVFPSFLYHKVHPITKGTRRSVAVWISGNPYK